MGILGQGPQNPYSEEESVCVWGGGNPPKSGQIKASTVWLGSGKVGLHRIHFSMQVETSSG